MEVVASRQGGPSVDEMLGIDSLPEPEAYAATVQRSTVEPQSPARRRTPQDPPIRDPALYAQTDHFHDRLRQQGRYITLERVAEAIEYGQLRWNTQDGWRFALTEAGVEYIVVVTDTETRSPVVVTGWTQLACEETARASDRWTENDLETIQLRTDLSTNRETQIPEQIRPRIVTHPFRVGGHRIITGPGEADVRCVDCAGKFRSKEELCSSYCPR